jgi:exodeoxyribonuclease VII small subunit
MIKNFEKDMCDLEKLVEKLEKGELSLQDSLSHFEKGVVLTKKCTQALAQAEQKVKKLTEDNELEPFIDFDDA